MTRLETNDETCAQYFAEIRRFPLLSRDQEVELAQRIETGKIAEGLLETDADASSITVEERQASIRRGELAHKKFVQSNLRLVVSVAKRYSASGISLLDRIQEGNLGLLEAVDRFDWRKGFKFSTYATWSIRQAVTRGIANTGRTIRLPVHAAQSVARVEITRALLEIKLRRSPTLQELTDASDLTEDDVVLYLQSAPAPRSLNEYTGDEFGTELGDLIQDDRTSTQDEALIAIMPAEISTLLGTLNEREQRIIRMRFGIDHNKTHTLTEIGNHLQLTRERVRQLELKALEKLRLPDAAQYARELLDA